MQITHDHRAAWNEFVARSPFGDVLQCWEWGELKARTGWEPLHCAVADGNRLLATALVLKRPLPHTRRSLLYCPRGPVVDPAAPDALPQIVSEMRALARRHGAIALKLDPAFPAERADLVAALHGCGLSPAAGGSGFGGVQPCAVMKVDLTPTPDELMAGFHSKWRYNIRLAARKGVTVRSECGREDMDAFFDLLRITARRDGFRVRSRAYFHDLWDLIIRPGLGTLFLVHADGVAVSGAIAFVLGKQCWYVYGASDNEHRDLMPNHLMQWEMMQWAQARGCTVYDMRGVSPEVDGEPCEPHLAGLNRFKRGFGATYVEYVGDWDLNLSPVWYWAFRKLLPVVRRSMARSALEPAEA